MGEIIIWDVDTQNDFFDVRFEDDKSEPIGEHPRDHYPIYQEIEPKLPVPDARTVTDNLVKLLMLEEKPGYRVMGSVDAHVGTEEHCKKWPAHCIRGTVGQEKIVPPLFRARRYISMEHWTNESLDVLVESRRALYFEKTQRPEDTDPDYCNSVRVNPNVEYVLEKVNPGMIAVCGVVLGYCVKGAVEYFLDLGYKVAVITDAIKEFDPNELKLYKEWADRGVLLTNTRTVTSGGLEKFVDGAA